MSAGSCDSMIQTCEIFIPPCALAEHHSLLHQRYFPCVVVTMFKSSSVPHRRDPRSSSSSSVCQSIVILARRHIKAISIGIIVAAIICIYIYMEQSNTHTTGKQHATKLNAPHSQQQRTVTNPSKSSDPSTQSAASSSSSSSSSSAHTDPPVVRAKQIRSLPHDTTAFTQGLLFHESNPSLLWESTGLYGRSQLRLVELESGKVVKSYALQQKDFAEGICFFKDKLFQLTWREKRAYVYSDLESFDSKGPSATFNYPMEGWGLTHDDTHLILSDGTSTLYYIDPDVSATYPHILILLSIFA